MQQERVARTLDAGSIGEAPWTDDVGDTFRGLRLAGLAATEAGNLTAHLAGLRIVGRPWTLPEIQRIHFLRSIVASRRLVS